MLNLNTNPFPSTHALDFNSHYDSQTGFCSRKREPICPDSRALEPENNSELPISEKIIPFNQFHDIILQLDHITNKTLLEIASKYRGLCELICNRILIDNSLGTGETPDSIKSQVTVKRLDTDTIKKSHLLDIHSIFTKVLAYLFEIYPDNIFSCFDQWKLVGETPTGKACVNRKILEQGLSTIPDRESLKLEVFSRDFPSFSGHSLLIKKVADDSYIFFDPNEGEYRDLSLDELSDKIDEQLKTMKGTDIYLTKGNCFLKRLRDSLGNDL